MKKKNYCDLENLTRDAETIYIICPKLTCDGFENDSMLCESNCPEKEAYKIIHCRYGHPNKLKISQGGWYRPNCSEEKCFTTICGAKITKYARISLESISIFLNKEFRRAV